MYTKFNLQNINKHWFTVVELIIVITIIAIVTSISFVSFSWYIWISRDSTRLVNIKEISKSLIVNKENKGLFPVPDNIYATWWISWINDEIFHVWTVWKNVSNYINISKVPKDPISWNEYLYWLTYDNQYFQLAWTMENWEILTYSIIKKVHASWDLKAIVEWNYKWILKFTSSWWENYVWTIPSLIYAKTWTYTWTKANKVFVTNKWKNLPYKINSKSLENPQDLYWTWIIIPNKIDENFIKNVKSKFWWKIPENIIVDVLLDKNNIIKKDNITHWNTNSWNTNSWNMLPEAPKDDCKDISTPTDEKFFTFDPKLKTITWFKKSWWVDIVIPCKIWGIYVEKIWDYSFNRKTINSVIIPNSVKYIWNYAFNTNSIKTLTIPSNVESIWDYAFISNKIETISLPDSLKIIWTFSFSDNLLKTLTIPSNVESIWDFSFNKNKLTSISLPVWIKSLWNSVFNGNWDNQRSSWITSSNPSWLWILDNAWKWVKK